VASTTEPTSTTGRFYIAATKDFNSYGRRESSEALVSE
jgi:hypothetical protein